ncbi:hypothetical protein [Paraburkholderia sp. BCC1884]|uniref:hypothetical protein n=1 Tax=Paraburkholderia sp. BCC1884 TaxID=2562668 RepID=UPI0016432CAA|nr:hypothetical protein [Paraburkholderia sp. BCC1884]
MSKSPKSSRSATRAPVDALQYEKLALSASRLIERHLSQLDKLLTLATAIYRSPAVTYDERCRQRTLLGMWLETGEDYRREVESDKELYDVIALDARGVAQSRLTARHAAKLLAKAARKAPTNFRAPMH